MKNKAKVTYKFREVKGNLMWENKNTDKVVFMEDALNGRFIFSKPSNVYNARGVDPYRKK